MNDADKMKQEKINGNDYKTCLAWKLVAGKDDACYHMCCFSQRNACRNRQNMDIKKEN